MRSLPILLLLAACAANAAPTRISCQYFKNNESGPYDGFVVHVFDVDSATHTISKSAEPLVVREWSDVEIIAENADGSIDTVPALTRYTIYRFDRLSGKIRWLGVWRSADGKVFRGTALEAVAGKHPMWNLPIPGGVFEPRTVVGECKALSQKF